MSEWQSIETADKESLRDIILWDGIRVATGSYYSDDGHEGAGWYATGEADMGDPMEATHWMPLPDPPVSSTVRGTEGSTDE